MFHRVWNTHTFTRTSALLSSSVVVIQQNAVSLRKNIQNRFHPFCSIASKIECSIWYANCHTQTHTHSTLWIAWTPSVLRYNRTATQYYLILSRAACHSWKIVCAIFLVCAHLLLLLLFGWHRRRRCRCVHMYYINLRVRCCSTIRWSVVHRMKMRFPIQI